jgi:hypothetical protein
MGNKQRKNISLLVTKHWWLRWLLPFAGLLGLVWFLVRVIPKPSRATYPCQRVAFPLASGFVVWLIGAIASLAAFRRAKCCFKRSRYVIGALCVAVSIGAAFFAMSGGLERVAIGSDPNPNEPIGTARGINPGRVVWVRDPDATKWNGPGTSDGYWFDNSATNRAVCDGMISMSLRQLTGQASDAAAWDALFKYYNQNKGKGDVGYQAGEKIMVKLNFVIFHRGDNIDGNGDQTGAFDQCFNAPQMVLALIRQLVDEVQVDPCDITIGSTTDGFPNKFYNPIQEEFPGVVCIDYHGTLPGRTKPTRSTTDFIYWSDPNSSYVEGVPTCYVDAEYHINFALLKGHPSAGITACAKNNFGSFMRTPLNYWHDWDDDYLDLHNFLPDAVSGMGHYRPFVDLMGSEHFDGKCALWLIDALYGCYRHQGNVEKWQMPPFNNDWPSSLFASQDPVAIDSVAYDFLWTEFNDVGTDHGLPHLDGAEDYLHEAARANDPCSGVFYDPDGDGNGLTSLGVHEHWNNATDKQYSRNLETGNGIELVKVVHHLGYMDDVADSDTAVAGTVSGSYIDTQTSNDSNEAIEEIESGGSPPSRYSYLEHKWRIDVTGNEKVTFHLQAHHTANGEGDDFVFACSTDDVNYTDIVTVTKTTDDDTYQSYELPNDVNGFVYIRVKDTDRTAGNRTLDTIYIDHMYVRSEPAGPAADFNGDNKVNFIDYAGLAAAFGTDSADPGYDDIYDLHDNDIIDMLDLDIFAEKWLWETKP